MSKQFEQFFVHDLNGVDRSSAEEGTDIVYRVLKAAPGVLLEEYLNENNNRLRDIFELVER